MRLKLSRTVTIVLFAGLLVTAATGCDKKSRVAERKARNSVVVEEIKSLLREGDIVFRRGDGLVSRAVLVADPQGAYSHIGVVVKGGNIVHIVPGEPDETGVEDVIKSEAPEAFFAPDKALEGVVMRLTGDGVVVESGGVATEEFVARVVRRAMELAATSMKFDHDYDLDDTTRMYCTELVWRIFESEGIDLTDGRRSQINLPGFKGYYILPTDIQSNQRLETIYRF